MILHIFTVLDLSLHSSCFDGTSPFFGFLSQFTLFIGAFLLSLKK